MKRTFLLLGHRNTWRMHSCCANFGFGQGGRFGTIADRGANK